ncbi:MAG: hypothetical protein ABIJ43_00350 [Candidatus Beckwithbacteria bacterium]|nr:hypothetical protein [Patescibacteria group bacterium]
MCLAYAPWVIKNCKRISQTREVQKKVKGKFKNSIQYELACFIKNEGKVKVVVEKIGTGKYKFLSIMRHKRRSKTKKRL